jgi:acetyltransferase-like isoleucine patch superfamily enzyme
LAFRLFFRAIYRKTFASYGDRIGWGNGYGPIIPQNIRIACPENITIGDECQFDEYTHLLATNRSRIVIGNNVRFANGFAHVVATFDEIVIEDHCLFAAFVQLITGNHGFDDVNTPIMDQLPCSTGPILVKRGGWVGRGANIMGGVTIGRNSVVGANAVVTRDVPDYTVVVGAPARVVKRYDCKAQSWREVSD